VRLTAEAYVYGFPLLFNLEEVKRFGTTGLGPNPPAPFNQFSHSRQLAGPKETFVSLNNGSGPLCACTSPAPPSSMRPT
jgi:hypothetical protein